MHIIADAPADRPAAFHPPHIRVPKCRHVRIQPHAPPPVAATFAEAAGDRFRDRPVAVFPAVAGSAQRQRFLQGRRPDHQCGRDRDSARTGARRRGQRRRHRQWAEHSARWHASGDARRRSAQDRRGTNTASSTRCPCRETRGGEYRCHTDQPTRAALSAIGHASRNRRHGARASHGGAGRQRGASGIGRGQR